MLQLGIPIFIAHMILIWYSIDSDVSPPIAVCAMAAAGIAQADPMKSMFTAWKYSKGLYILPFLFYYRPLLLNGPVLDVLITIASSTLGLVVAACFLERYLFRKTTMIEQSSSASRLALLLWPPLLCNIAGVLALAVVSLSRRDRMPDSRTLSPGSRMKSRASQTISTDLLIIGGGAAGCFAALKAREAGVQEHPHCGQGTCRKERLRHLRGRLLQGIYSGGGPLRDMVRKGRGSRLLHERPGLDPGSPERGL